MKRRAASPVVAELILVFVTVIIAVPLGGFLFSTAGAYTKTADVSVNTAICATGTAPNTTLCSLNLDNLGAANANLKPSSYLLVSYGSTTSSSYSSTCAGQGSNTVKAGSSLIVQCLFNVAAGQPGDRFTGWVALVSGQDLPFAGSF